MKIPEIAKRVENGKIQYMNRIIQYKNRILKAIREKKRIIYKGNPIRITADFSAQTVKSRRAWNVVFQTPRENDLQPRWILSSKLPSKADGQIMYFHDKEH